MNLKNIFLLILLNLLLVNSVIAYENSLIKTEIIGLPEKLESNTTYKFTIKVGNIGLNNLSEIKGHISAPFPYIEIKNRYIDIKRLETKKGINFNSSITSKKESFSTNIQVIIESYVIDNTTKYRGEEGVRIIEDRKKIVGTTLTSKPIEITQPTQQNPSPPFAIIVSILIISALLISYLILKKK